MTGSVFPDHVVALFGKNTPIASVPKFVSATKDQGDRNWQVPAQTDLPTEALNGVSWVEFCQFVVLIMTSELRSQLSTKARVAQSMCGLAPRAQDDHQAIDHCARQPGVCARSDQNPDCR
jgi:hypothetical protein